MASYSRGGNSLLQQKIERRLHSSAKVDYTRQVKSDPVDTFHQQ